MAGRAAARGASRSKIALLVLGLAVGAAVLCAEWLGLGSGAGFGEADLTALAIAGALVLVAALPWHGRAGLWLGRLGLALFATYASLALADAAIYLHHRLPSELKDSRPSLKGMYRADEANGFALSPHWTGVADMGLAAGSVRINSRGQRDDEPRTDVPRERRILLGGDSFAFGAYLNQEETIDRQIESMSDGRFDVYNLAVPGYGTPHVLESFRRAAAEPAAGFLYVFYWNDLVPAELDRTRKTVYGGYLVPSRDPDGRPYTAEEYDRQIERFLKASRIAAWLRNTVRLSNLRDQIRFAFTDDRTTLYGCSPAQVQQVLAMTQDMRRLAEERGMFFKVVLVPDRNDVVMGIQPPLVRAYTDGLRQAGIEVIDTLPVLAAEDYFPVDAHTNASGARKIARAILDSLGE